MARTLLPSTGRLVYYRPPAEDDHVRVDTGVYEGGEVSMYYDPIVAKLITWGEDREQAIEMMRAALDKFVVRGIATNISFLSALVAHERYVTGNINTNTIAEEYPEGFHPADVPHEEPAEIISVVGMPVTSVNLAHTHSLVSEKFGEPNAPGRWLSHRWTARS